MGSLVSHSHRRQHSLSGPKQCPKTGFPSYILQESLEGLQFTMASSSMFENKSVLFILRVTLKHFI